MTTTSGHTTAVRAAHVLGRSVKNEAGESLGKVEDIILDKTDNRILFAVMSFGGFLGIGEKYHPIPWSVLDYDPDETSFVVPYSREQLTDAPHDTIDELTRDDGLGYRDRVYDYYDAPKYW